MMPHKLLRVLFNNCKSYRSSNWMLSCRVCCVTPLCETRNSLLLFQIENKQHDPFKNGIPD
jgi:hypothetical protein